MTSPNLAADAELTRLVGERAITPGTSADAIVGVVPAFIVEPDSAEALAAALAHCSTTGLSVVVRGGGSRQEWGKPPRGVDVVLSTRRLARVVRYEPGDLTVAVDAGLTVSGLNRELAQHGQTLPVDVASDLSTIGGAIATNDSGPLRHRYGSIRDQLIGIRLATTDGRLASAGGNVVKNVAGYDLGKLVSGSFGTLAVIVGATFKLAPIPASTETLALTFANAVDLGAAAAVIASSQLDAMCLDAHVVLPATDAARASYRLSARFGGVASVNLVQISNAEHLVASTRPLGLERLKGDVDRAHWTDLGRFAWTGTGTVLRASWLPSALADVLDFLRESGRTTGVDIQCVARAGMGTGVMHLAGSAAAIGTCIERLRSRPELFGHVVLMRAPLDVHAVVDAWGTPGSTAGLLAAIKAVLDPAGVLGAGRGPV